MPVVTSAQLDTGSTFPPLTFSLVGGGELSLPANSWQVIIAYRGGW